jgi:hypothetical protein
MMKVRFCSLGILVLLASMAATPPSVAGLDVDLGLSMSTGDDSRLFVNICARYFNHEPRFVEGWAVRYANPDDLAVAMFISQRSSRSPDVVFALRQQGMTWWDIGLRLGVPVNAWFVPVEHDPGPPYGKAYGYWKKHQRNPKYIVVLNDHDARNLVAVRMAHEYYAVPAEKAMQWRGSGRNVRDVMVWEYEQRHVRPRGASDEDWNHHGDRDDDHGKNGKHDKGGNSHGKGHSKG